MENPQHTIRILDVGQCGFDGPRMASLWKDKLGATVKRVESGEEALRELKKERYDLVLVNRVLAETGSSGMEVIQQVVDHDQSVPVLLVSDRPEAQDEAVALGAIRGFGKADLETQETLQIVRRAATRWTHATKEERDPH